MQQLDEAIAGPNSGLDTHGAAAAAPARTAQPADGRGEAAPAGAPSSNRAPANYIEESGRILRCAIDSLYLSFVGELSDLRDWQLNELKKLAQSDSEVIQARAQIRIGEHMFQVLDHGKKKRCPYILDNSAMRLEIGRGGGMPLAVVQIKNQFLVETGVDETAQVVRFVVGSLGKVDGPEKVSRADLCADFVPCQPLRQWPNDSWVTRAKRRTPHYEGDRFTGWSIGKGGMSARLYDKLFELVTISRKDYLLTLWQQTGWQIDEPVWRLEFQLRRAVLKEMGIGSVDDLLGNLAAIWAYGSEKWLLLKVPNTDDSNQSRWPLHPLWALLQCAEFGDQRQPALTRSRPASLPSDYWLFTNGLGAVTSYMARENLPDFEEALPRFFADASDFHERQGKTIERYAEIKARAKGRRFGTINNRPETLPDLEAQAVAAEHYRQTKDGE